MVSRRGLLPLSRVWSSIPVLLGFPVIFRADEGSWCHRILGSGATGGDGKPWAGTHSFVTVFYHELDRSWGCGWRQEPRW